VKDLMIRDLTMTEELDRKAMAGVRGGIAVGEPAPGCFPVPSAPFDWRNIRIGELLGLKPEFPIARNVPLPQYVPA
jgi:hypothetical protein